jgi:hypothetical protein
VICSSVEDVHGFRIHGPGQMQTADPNEFGSYGPGVWWAEEFYAGDASAGALRVPKDSRTTASPAGTERFAFYSPGGWSWSIPYIAGANPLAAQVDPDITLDEFWRPALQTGTPYRDRPRWPDILPLADPESRAVHRRVRQESGEARKGSASPLRMQLVSGY